MPIVGGLGIAALFWFAAEYEHMTGWKWALASLAVTSPSIPRVTQARQEAETNTDWAAREAEREAADEAARKERP